jgi:hypothetical protein
MTDAVVDPDKFVSVGKFLGPANAQMAKGMLESAGIECFLQGEQANLLNAFAFRARLKVGEADAETARELLAGSADLVEGDVGDE